MITVQLKDGRRVDVNTDDPQKAARAARVFSLREQIAAEDEKTYSPSNVPDSENLMAGIGKSFVDTGRGIKQLGAEAGNAVGLVDDSTVSSLRSEQDQRSQQDAPLMGTKAGLGGYIGGLVAQTAAPAALIGRAAQVAGMGRTAATMTAFNNPATYGAAAASGAAQGVVRPVGTEDSRAVNTALGAATGMAGLAVVNTAARIAQPVRNALQPAQQWAVRELERLGIPLDLSQRTGSIFAQRVRRALKDNPVTADTQAAFAETQRRAYAGAVLKTVGANADAATPNVLSAVDDRIGNVMDDFAQRHGVVYDQTLESDLIRILRNAKNELEDPQYSVVRSQVYEALDKAALNNGVIPGQAYQNIRTAIGRISMGPDQSKGHWLRNLRDALDDGLERSVPKSEVAVLKDARQQWRRLKQIEGAVDEAGNISPAKLFNGMTKKASRQQSLYGHGDQALVRIARAGKIILKDGMADSGTPAGLAAQAMLPVGAAMATQAITGDPEKALKAGALVYGIPRAAAALMQNPTAVNYLAGGLPQGVIRNSLTAPANQLGPVLKAIPPALLYGSQQ
jgi:hypothetical protein